MANEINIPGYDEAVASERRDRALAFLALPESICDIECAPMTPLRLEWLRAVDNAFITGGALTEACALQFLWLVSPKFTPGNEGRDAFLATLHDLDFEELCEEIDEYLDRAFLDAPQGKIKDRPLFSTAASLCYVMLEMSPYWTIDRTLNTPLAQLYQLIKVRDKSMKIPVVNRRSDKVRGDWLRDLNEQLARQREEQKGSPNA